MNFDLLRSEDVETKFSAYGFLSIARHIKKGRGFGHYGYVSRCRMVELDELKAKHGVLGYRKLRGDKLALIILVPFTGSGDNPQISLLRAGQIDKKIQWFSSVRLAKKEKGLRFYFRKNILVNPPRRNILFVEFHKVRIERDGSAPKLSSVLLLGFDVPTHTVPLAQKVTNGEDRRADTTTGRKGRV